METIKAASVEAVGDAVAKANLAKQKVWARRRKKQEAPDWADVVIDLSALKAVKHQPEDMIVTVETGIPLAKLQEELAKKGQRIPLDLPPDKDLTLGEAIDRDLWGALKLRHGSFRDWVLGSTVVRFDGKAVKDGGIVVKNVTGYDLSKLYIGARGALGIIVRVNLKLAPVPRATGSVVVGNLDPARAFTLVGDLRNGVHPLVSAVYHDRDLLLGFEGYEGVLGGQLDDVVKVSGGRRVSEEAAGILGEAHAKVRSRAVMELLHPPASGPELLADLCPPEHLSLPGLGVMFLPAPADPGRVVAACKAVGGWCRPGRIPDQTLGIMKRLKASMDPPGIFGPVGEEA
jgi:glycolate oxidase FAD binding subunit